jgi:hypothetical protein
LPAASFLSELTAADQIELAAASDVELDEIACAMVSLAADQEELPGIAEDDASLSGLRGVARAVAPIARDIWSQFGGDGGGW